MKMSCLLSLVFCLLMACAGADYMPQYFEGKAPETNITPKPPDEGAGPTGSCTVSLKSTLCVYIKGEHIEVGLVGEPLCAEIDPIPIEVTGGVNLIIRGNAFPDIPFEGHGLPAPIIINGKGTTDGTQNLGKGTLDQSGNITIEDLSLYINALGMVGELPQITFTTEKAGEVSDLPELEGSPVNTKGELTLVTGLTVGHLFPAADEKLFGASLQATLDGTISPLFSECKGETSKPQSTFVTKLVIDAEGRQTDALLPGSTRMEMGSGTFISEGPQDIGPKFETSAKFKIENATAKPLPIDLPQMAGAFAIEALNGGELLQNLAPKAPLVIKVTFRPTIENTQSEGEVSEILPIGPDIYQLVGRAVRSAGDISLSIVDDAGKTITEQTDKINTGDVTVLANPRREFFMCKNIICNGEGRPTQCVPCVDVLTNACQLLMTDSDGNPMDAVDEKCHTINGANSLAISNALTPPAKQLLKIKNTGPKPLTVKSIEIKEMPASKSINQFKLGTFAPPPVTIEPFDIGSDFLQLAVIYEPTDLIGFDGTEAVVGHPAKDKAILYITTDSGNLTVEITGKTEVKETPALEVYIKTSTGTKAKTDGSVFAFRGITAETSDMPVPLFIKLSDSATTPLRITKIEMTGENFEWLDTKAKIDIKPDATRCTIPIFDANGNQTGAITDLKPVGMVSGGLDMQPGAYTTDTMPLFGCANFHMGEAKQRKYESNLVIYTQELASDGQPIRNPDGSIKQTNFTIRLLAVVNPLKGRMVLRLTQTMTVLMNPQFPSISSEAADKEAKLYAAAASSNIVSPVLLSSFILDPFDEETIKNEQGEVLSMPGDGITAVYRHIDTHPVSLTYDDPLLPDYVNLIYDATAEEGKRGIFFDYENVPRDTPFSGLRVLTSSLSYPGPLATPEKRPDHISQCEQINPCDIEEQKKFGTGPTEPGKKGVCAFFYTSLGSWESPGLRKPEEMDGGERADLCKSVGKPQKINDVAGTYDLDGSMVFSNLGLRLWGPTYVHNPIGPIGPYPPLDAVLNVTFTTGVLLPNEEGGPDLIPDKRVNIGKQEYKINLTDTTMETPRICENGVRNRVINNERYSSWKYLAPLLTKDEQGTTPAGCPEPGNNFTGGSAFLRGKPLDQETGIFSFVSVAKFASDDNLSFAFKDVMAFVVLNGWFCDPDGAEEEFEGAKCFDRMRNERDGLSQTSIMD